MTTKKAFRPGITKADLVDVVYERHGGLTKDEAAQIVDVIFRAVKTSLADGLARMAAWVRVHGARTSAPFEGIEITKNLPASWQVR